MIIRRMQVERMFYEIVRNTLMRTAHGAGAPKYEFAFRVDREIRVDRTGKEKKKTTVLKC